MRHGPFWLSIRRVREGEDCQFWCGCRGRVFDGLWSVTWHRPLDWVCRRHARVEPYDEIWGDGAA